LQTESDLFRRHTEQLRALQLPEHFITATIAVKPLACELSSRVEFADRIGGIVEQGLDFQKLFAERATNSTPKDFSHGDVIARDPGKPAATANEAF
jgi:hypothetical protein